MPTDSSSKKSRRGSSGKKEADKTVAAYLSTVAFKNKSAVMRRSAVKSALDIEYILNKIKTMKSLPEEDSQGGHDIVAALTNALMMVKATKKLLDDIAPLVAAYKRTETEGAGVVEDAVQIGSKDPAVGGDAAVQNINTVAATLEDACKWAWSIRIVRLPHVDFISAQFVPAVGSDCTARLFQARHGLVGFLDGQHGCFNRQETETLGFRQGRFHPPRVEHPSSQHLVTAADPDYPALKTCHGVVKPLFPEEQQVTDGGFAARDDQDIEPLDLFRFLDIAEIVVASFGSLRA